MPEQRRAEWSPGVRQGRFSRQDLSEDSQVRKTREVTQLTRIGTMPQPGPRLALWPHKPTSPGKAPPLPQVIQAPAQLGLGTHSQQGLAPRARSTWTSGLDVM